MSATLFEMPEQLSPRLAWMERHQVVIHHNHHGTMIEEDPETGSDIYPVIAASGAEFDEDGTLLNGIYGRGITEDEALASLAKRLKVKLWNEECKMFHQKL